jgi:hypothetical protein
MNHDSAGPSGEWPDLDKEEGLVSVSIDSPTTTLQENQSPLKLRLAIVDPIGRMSDLTTLIV